MEISDNSVLGMLFGDTAKDAAPDRCPVPDGMFPSEFSLAMAYVPFQQWETPYENDVALSRGTVFPALDKPFIGEEAVKNANAK